MNDRVFCVDISGSMSSGDIQPESSEWQGNRLGCVLEKVDAFMETKKRATKDVFTLIKFESSANIVFQQKSAADPTARNQLKSVRVRGGTNFSAALQCTNNMLFNCWTSRHSVKILFLSDGHGGNADSQVQTIMQAGKEAKRGTVFWCGFFDSLE